MPSDEPLVRLQMGGTGGGSRASGQVSHPFLSIGSGGGGLMDASVSAAISAMQLGTDLFVDLCVSPKDTTSSAPGFCAPPPPPPAPSLSAAAGGGLGSDAGPPAPADPPLDATYDAPGLLPAVSQADTSLCNQSMFSGYMPALTHRLYLAPILYAGYLAAWRAAAGAAKGSAAAARLLGAATALAWGKGAPALLRFLAVLRAAAAAGARAFATMAHSGIKRLAHSVGEAAAGGSGGTCSDGLSVLTGRLVGLLRSALTRCRPRLSAGHGMSRVAAQTKRGGASSLLSFPLNSRSTEDLCGPDADEDDDNQTPGHGNRYKQQPSLSPALIRQDSMDSTSTRGSGGGGSRRGGFARRLLRVAAVAAQAAGVPLAHAWLSGRGAGGGGGSRALPAASSGLGKPPLAPRRSGAESSRPPGSSKPPQPQRGGGPPPQPQRSRALTQLMLGLQPTHLHRAAAAAQEQKQQEQQLRRQSQFQPVGAATMGGNGATQQRGGGGGGARSEGRRRSIESEIFI